MTHTQRFLVITAVLVLAAVVGLYFLTRHLEYALVERPYIAAVKSDLRALAIAEDSVRRSTSLFTMDLAAVRPRRVRLAGVRMEILRADADGFLAEGLHEVWKGRCVIALGRYTGDSLTPGEPLCHAP